MTEPTQKDIEDWIERVKTMSHTELARLWRFAPSGHPVFRDDLPIYKVFHDRFFAECGGMTPAISKEIGWD